LEELDLVLLTSLTVTVLQQALAELNSASSRTHSTVIIRQASILEYVLQILVQAPTVVLLEEVALKVFAPQDKHVLVVVRDIFASILQALFAVKLLHHLSRKHPAQPHAYQASPKSCSASSLTNVHVVAVTVVSVVWNRGEYSLECVA
jgi:hypothetical protein